MPAYPLELRERIVAAVDAQHGTIAELAELFRVTERYVYKLLKQRRDTSDLAPRPHSGGAVAKLNEAKLLELAELVAQSPDATLDELRQLLRRKSRLSVSLSTIWRGLEQIRMTLKKRPAAPAKPARKNARPLAKSN